MYTRIIKMFVLPWLSVMCCFEQQILLSTWLKHSGGLCTQNHLVSICLLSSPGCFTLVTKCSYCIYPYIEARAYFLRFLTQHFNESSISLNQDLHFLLFTSTDEASVEWQFVHQFDCMVVGHYVYISVWTSLIYEMLQVYHVLANVEKCQWTW